MRRLPRLIRRTMPHQAYNYSLRRAIIFSAAILCVLCCNLLHGRCVIVFPQASDALHCEFSALPRFSLNPVTAKDRVVRQIRVMMDPLLTTSFSHRQRAVDYS
ncbi:hypothetical protein SSJG_03285 [Escherichia coli D9]|nr:hypothetical protein SSJG_03285 [Escherichia coli D9]